MAEEKQSGLGFGGNGFLWLLVVAAGTAFIHQLSPLEDARPVPALSKLHDSPPPQDVDARLWQDPFTAVKKAVAAAAEDDARKIRLQFELGSAAPQTAVAFKAERQHRLNSHAADLVHIRDNTTILMVTVPGATSSEETEARRRYRYAVLAALHVGHYAPTDAYHVGYFEHQLGKAAPAPELRVVPFEEFENPAESKRVLVLWIDEDALGGTPLAALGELTCTALRLREDTRTKVVGPSDGGTVRLMRGESPRDAHCAPPEFYAYGVTTEGRLQSVDYHPMIASDTQLIDLLTAELANRNVDIAHQVAIVAEIDTAYGRAFADRFMQHLSRPGDLPLKYGYLRGLDGQLPGVGQAGEGRSGGSRPEHAADRRADGPALPWQAKPGEHADGDGQFDYLRRLAGRIRQDAGGDLKAIGIVGSDVYDKLLILRALRPEFPEAVFFTTNLDARLLDRSERHWTRNLLVASGYGLQLHASRQREIPPFRDSYQTAAFLSTQLALGQVVRAAEPPAPLLFQVGRSRPVKLPAAAAEWRDCRPDHLPSDGCLQLVEPPYGKLTGPKGLVLAVAVALALFGIGFVCRAVLAYTRVLLRHDTSMGPPRVDRASALLWGEVAFVAALLLATGWPAIADRLAENGEPLLLFEAVSLWPSIVLRLFSALLGGYLIFRTLFRLDQNVDDIAIRLDMGLQRQDILRDHRWTVAEALSLPKLPADSDMHISVSRYWAIYVKHGRTRERLCRVGACIAAMVLLFGVVGALYQFPHSFARVAWMQWLEMLAAFAEIFVMLSLVFLVADASLLSCYFVRQLRRRPSIWPDATKADAARRLGLPAHLLDDWIDMEYIALRTKCIIGLIYWPFLLLALLVVIRSGALYAGFSLNPTIVVPAAVSIAILVGCVIWLRWEAEEARKTTQKNLHERMIAARGASSDAETSGRAAQLEALLQRVATTHEGAFSPMSHQPLVRALLLPLGGYGGTALLQYLVLPGY